VDASVKFPERQRQIDGLQELIDMDSGLYKRNNTHPDNANAQPPRFREIGVGTIRTMGEGSSS